MNKRYDELFGAIVTILRRDYAGLENLDDRFDPRYYNTAIGQAWHDGKLDELLFLRYINQMLACTGDRHLRFTMRPTDAYKPWSCGFFTRRYGDSLYVTAILTIVGFSVHDTIVIFDRIRENLRKRLRGETFAALINRSLLETFSRSINTTVTVLVTLLALVFFGGKLLMGFYVAMLAGTIIGSYSSLFIAAQLVDLWNKWATGEKLTVKNDFEEKAMVDVTAAATEAASEVKEAGEEVAKKAKKAAKNTSGRIKKTKKRF